MLSLDSGAAFVGMEAKCHLLLQLEFFHGASRCRSTWGVTNQRRFWQQVLKAEVADKAVAVPHGTPTKQLHGKTDSATQTPTELHQRLTAGTAPSFVRFST
jgi:hypothetical protein